MTPYTPPEELFREIVECQELILELLRAKGTRVRHWPTYYLLYVEVDRIGWSVRRVADCIAQPLFAVERGPATNAIAVANDCLSSLQQQQTAIVTWLQAWSLHDLRISVADNELRHRLYSHFRPKSAWIETFFDQYGAGKIIATGTRLETTILVFDPQPTYRNPDLKEKGLLRHQVFDLTTAAAWDALADAIVDVERRLDTVRSAMRCYLAEHCTLEQLLDPSTY